MIAAPIPDNDVERVASLRSMKLLSTPREGDLDRATRTARRLFNAPIALISLVDEHRQWFKSRYGLEVSETPRDISFCGHAIAHEDTFVVGDAARDDRFHDNPLVTGEPKIRFYAGQPLVNGAGHRIGTLCVLSTEPREISDSEREGLRDLGRIVEVLLEHRRLSDAQHALIDELDATKRDRMIDAVSGLWARQGLEQLFARELARAARQTVPVCVATARIDLFDEITRTLGTRGADEAVRHVAEAFTRSARAHDLVGRVDENCFALVMLGVYPAMLPTIGEKLLRTIRSKVRIATDMGDLPLSASIGLNTLIPDRTWQAASLSAWLKGVREAMERANAQGGDRYEIVGSSPDRLAEFALA